LKLKLNIVSFDVPYPPNYGGIIDVYYKIKALHDLGVKIFLHTYEYGSGKHVELENVCEKVYYYERNLSFINQISKIPFIVKSRLNHELLNNLNENDYPILFEGLHSTGFICDVLLSNRIKVVRTHNVEHDYYSSLAHQESNIFRKVYFGIESLKLKKYESILKYADLVLALGFDDFKYFSKRYKTKVEYIPVFSSNNFNLKFADDNIDKFILIHGDLSVQDNIKSISLLLDKVLVKNSFKVKIAGKNPSSELLKYSSEKIEIMSNPTLQEMDNLISTAQVILLNSNQSTGVKLKLIESLSKGKFILCNSNIVANTNLHKFCTVEDDISLYKSIITELMNREINKKILLRRFDFLKLNYGNEFSANKIINFIQQVLQQK
jgi:hypothetical protein